MLTAIDGSGGSGDRDTRVSLDANPIAALFFVLAQLMLNAFILELFAGSIIDTYDRLRDETRGSILLTDSQVSAGPSAVTYASALIFEVRSTCRKIGFSLSSILCLCGRRGAAVRLRTCLRVDISTRT